MDPFLIAIVAVAAAVAVTGLWRRRPPRPRDAGPTPDIETDLLHGRGRPAPDAAAPPHRPRESRPELDTDLLHGGAAVRPDPAEPAPRRRNNRDNDTDLLGGGQP